jgi:transposase
MSAQGETVSASGSSNSAVDIFVSIEMSRAKWVIGVRTPLADKIAIHGVAAGDADAILALIERFRSRIVSVQGSTPSVLCCYEAGYEGFWLQRRFAALGIKVIVIDPASLLVNRRAKRAKTDRIDARDMVRALMAHARGEHQVLSAVRVPSVEQDDDRRLLRERQRLIKERTAHTNRIKGLLKTQGIPEFNPRAADAVQQLEGLITGDGRPLGHRLKAEIIRELQRLALLMQQLAQVEAERDRVIREAKTQLAEEPAADRRRDGTMLATLSRLKGIGANDASMLVREAFWRDFRNRRELGGWSGLAPAPWASGSVTRDQGITKAGPPLLRAQMMQIAWRWLFWQPDSRLALWFKERTAGATGRMRRILVVALARKLFVALWRYATTGLVPEGAIVT